MTADPKTPSPVSSTPILRTILVWYSLATGILVVAGAIGGYLVSGVTGLWSALVGVLLAAVFLAITALSILIANRWYGDPLYVPIFFGVVLGGFIVKFVVVIVALLILRAQPWIDPIVFFIAAVAAVLTSLVVDMVTIVRLRVPTVSDTTLPSDVPDDAP